MVEKINTISSSFPPDHNEVLASWAISRGGSGCPCAMCLRLAGSRPSEPPKLPPGLGGWMRDMSGQLQGAMAEIREEVEAEEAIAAAGVLGAAPPLSLIHI